MINQELEKVNEVNEVYEQMMGSSGRLLGYQKASVKAICEHFKGHNKALLADEVGLGKTEIAKGVIATMVKEYKEKNPDSKSSFRVVYICPNQNIAEQNYRKLHIYGQSRSEFTVPKDIGKAIKKNMESFKEKAIEDCQKRRYTTLKSKIEKTSVFTRVWDWLVRISKGRTIEDAIDEDYVLMCRGEEDSYSDDWSETNNEWGINGVKSEELKSCLYKNFEILSKSTTAESPVFAKICEIVAKGYNNFAIKNIYHMNKEIAAYMLLGQTDFQYRISMLHLYEMESNFFSQGKPMTLESLTPATSFSYDIYGKDRERALIGATYDCIFSDIFSEKTFESDPRKNDANEDYSKQYKELYEEFKSRLNSRKKDSEQYLDEIKEKLNEITNGGKNVDFKKIRNALIDYNLDHIKYDLVIMDEYQNYEELIGGDGEVNRIAEKIFSNDETKVLMLSATPFAVSDYVPELISSDTDDEQEESVENFGGKRKVVSSSDEVYTQFLNLINFMLGRDDKEFSSWKNRWEKAINENNEDDLRELLMDKAGIYRTERIAAAKHDPIKAITTKDLDQSFEYVLRANKAASDLGLSGWRKDYGCSTPMAMTFSYSYKIKDEENKNFYKNVPVDLLLKKSELQNSKSISFNNPKYDECKRIIFAEGKIAKLLWIPPVSSECELKGPFEGLKGISKTIIFTRYRMTAMSLTFLLAHEAKCKINVEEKFTKAKLEDNDRNDLKSVLEKYVNNNLVCISNYPNTKIALTDYLVALFNYEFAKKAVFSSYVGDEYAHKRYSELVIRYCNDGCLTEVIKEYIELLENEYGEDDRKIARTIRGLGHCLDTSKTKPHLVLDAGNVVDIKEMGPDNPFAVGLYSEKPSEAATRLKYIKNAFNSPFIPFVFCTTSIGTEGIDLHWYARNVIHWSLPNKPVDIEQRTGRVMRYNCHAVRLNKALIEDDQCKKKAAISEGWEESGMYNTQLNFFSEDDYSEKGNEGCFHVNSYFFSEKNSKESLLYDEYDKIVKTYRSMIGRKETSDNVNKAGLCLAPWLKQK